MADYFWKYPVTCNAGCHAKRGVGPATDYGVPWGTPIHAPFAGNVQWYWTDEGGNGLAIVRTDGRYTCRVQHLAEKPKEGHAEWRSVIAKSGNTGSATTGPHAHAYIIDNWTGERMSFQKWLEDVVPKEATGTPVVTPPPAPTPVPPAARKFKTKQAYWYTSRGDANALVRVHGNGNGTDRKYTNEKMLIGEYDIVNDPGDSFAVRANDGSVVWVSRLLRGNIV